MRFLKSLPGKLKGEVEQVINDEALDFAEKFTLLKDLIDDPDILLQVLHHLKTNKKKEEKKPSEENWKTTMKADPDVSLASDGNRSFGGSTCSLAIGSSTPLSHKPESENEKGETPSRQPGSNSQTTLINEDLDEDEMKENEEYDEEENSAPNFFNHMKRIFGDPKKHEPPVAAKETDTTRRANSPLSLTEEMKPDCVKIIHETVVSSLSPTAKFAVIASIYREDESVYKKFTTWWNNQPGIALGQSLLGVPWPQSVFDGAMKTLEDWMLLNRSEKSKSACSETDASAGCHEVSTQDSSELTSIPISKPSVLPKPIIPPAKERSESPLRTIPSSPRKRSKSPLKPRLPAPRKRSESPKFKAAHQPKIKAMNILLLGDIGVGKTTFINGLANYLKFETLDEAMAGESRILVDASFRITGNDGKARTITVKANTGVDANSSSRNERLGVSGRSSTQEPMDHIFEWMHGGEKKLVRIVDTPGCNDFCGTEENEKNMDKILKHVAELGELHAVCIVMKPNESKMTVGFRYCFDEVIQKLAKNATKNILFCFTNTRSTQYRPGETLSILHEFLKKVETETGVCIAANRSNIFCYDNDTFRYLCVLRQLPNALTETTGLSTKATFSDGWIHNVKESEMMLKRVQGHTAHFVENMMAMVKARKVVTALARLLGEIARNHVVNMKMIQDKMEEVENLENSGRALDELLSQEQVVLDYVPLAQPRTVCAAPKCVAYVQIRELEMFPDYVTICHNPCHLYGVQQNSVMNGALKNCQVFNYMGNCEKCGCSWENHMHINYELKYKMAKRVDQDTLNKRDQCSNKKQKAELVLSDLKENLERLEREKEQIHDNCAEFSAFLSMNCTKQTCDPFAEYLRHLSDDENSKCENGGGNMEIAVAVCMMRNDYAKRVNFIKEEIKSGRRDALSTRQLNTKIANLSKLKLCGHIIAELMNEDLFKETKNDDQLSDNLGHMSLGSNGRKATKDNLEETLAGSSTD